MKITLFYYSGAGNTMFIAKKVKMHLEANNHEVEMMRITQNTLAGFKQDADAYLIGFPVYDLSPPLLVQDLVRNLKSENKTIAYFCTKAFLSADSIKELHEVSSNKGFKTTASLDLFMPATDMLALFAKQGSRTERILKSFHSKKLDRKITLFIRTMEKGKEQHFYKKWYVNLAYLIPKKTKQAFHDQYTKYIPEFFSKSDVCIQCMLCVKGCPRDNIRFEEGIKFGLNCDMCLACLHHCPVDSIQLGNYTQGTVRLRKIEINE